MGRGTREKVSIGGWASGLGPGVWKLGGWSRGWEVGPGEVRKGYL
jgi:hypothetical protein